jgi:predicted NAD/FAD-binding protein
MSLPRLAIIGTGISGLGCAHFLHRRFDFTMFEANGYIGGHTNTVTVKEDGRDLPIDTGFMVFNHHTYPLLCRLFGTRCRDQAHGHVLQPRAQESGYEWNGGSLDQIFGQRKNLLSPRFWRFMLQINRFNQETIEAMNDPRSSA